MITFTQFATEVIKSPILSITVILTLGVIIVNGWTDAPNAIATCVSTRALKPFVAVAMAAVFNFLGVAIFTHFNSKVAMSIYNMVDFGKEVREASIALCAALFAIILWAVFAWKFGIPTSESHALIAGLSGAAIALHGGLDGININEWIKAIYGLFLSSVLGFCFGFFCVRIIEYIFKNTNRTHTLPFFRNAQITGGAAMAFMHGAQDGQKFMSVFLIGLFLTRQNTPTSITSIPFWLMLLCSSVMGFGALIGGYKIIKSVGMDMVRLETYQGFAADLGAALCLLLSSLIGFPISTTHTKTTAIMGVGASKRLSSVNWKIVFNMALAWIFTFPGCSLLGYITAKLFMWGGSL